MAAKELITGEQVIEIVNNEIQKALDKNGVKECIATRCGIYKAYFEWLVNTNPLWCAENLYFGKMEYVIVRYASIHSITGEEIIRCSREERARELMAGFMAEDPDMHYSISDKFVLKNNKI